MATRLYLSTEAAPYTPATPRGAWDSTASSVAKYLWHPLDGTKTQTYTTVATAETDAGGDYDVLLGRWVSAPLAAQTISGTIDGFVEVAESSADANMALHVHIYVTEGDSDSVRGTLLTDLVMGSGTEWASSIWMYARGLGGAQAVSSVATTAGDRVVIELGYIARNTSATSYTGTLVYGYTTTKSDIVSESDYTYTFSVDTYAENPWFEFSGDLVFAAQDAIIAQVATEVLASEPANAVIAQVATEVLASEPANAVIAQVAVEVLISAAPPTQTTAATASLATWTTVAATLLVGAISTAVSATWVVPSATTTAGAVSTMAAQFSVTWGVPAANGILLVPATATSAFWVVKDYPTIYQTAHTSAVGVTWVTASASVSAGAISTPGTTIPVTWVVPSASRQHVPPGSVHLHSAYYGKTLQEIVNALSNGWLVWYDGTQPVNADTAITTQREMATFRMGTPAGYVSATVVRMGLILPVDTFDRAGTVTWMRAFKADATTVVFDCAAGVAPSDMVLTPTATAVAHDIGRVTSLVFEWV